METVRILLVETDRALVERARRTLERSRVARFQLDVAPTATVAAARGHSPPDVVVLDVHETDGGAPRYLREVRLAYPAAAVILVAAGEGLAKALDLLPDDQPGFVFSRLEDRALDRIALAAAQRRRRSHELQRRIRDLEDGEHNLRSIVRTTSDGIMIVDAEGTICFSNPAAERMFGRSGEELIGQPFGFPLLAGDITEIDIVRRDGQALIAELRTTETEWAGRPARLAALRDITARRQAEEQARELVREHTRRLVAEQNERRTRFLADATRVLASTLDDRTALASLANVVVPLLADCCIFDLIDPDGSLQRVALAASDVAEPIAARCRDRAPAVATSAAVARAIRSGQPWIARDGGDPDWLAALGLGAAESPTTATGLIAPLVTRDAPLALMTLVRTAGRGEFTDAELLLAREIAQRAAVAIDNARLYRQAQEAARVKSDFLAVMSHELRTPLNAVIGYSELLQMGVPAQLPNVALEHVRRIRASASHLLSLIDEILTFTSLETGRGDVRLEEVNAGALAREAAAIVEPLAHQRHLRLDVLLPPRDVRLHTDPRKLRQILLNLLSNAVKFTDEGAVALRLDADAQSVTVSVHDTGCGIAPEDLPRIFDPFWQAEQSRTRNAEGTGLGLAVARRLAHLIAADLNVDSLPGAGSTFTLRLPTRFPLLRPSS